jgi:hypothetical protein
VEEFEQQLRKALSTVKTLEDNEVKPVHSHEAFVTDANEEDTQDTKKICEKIPIMDL